MKPRIVSGMRPTGKLHLGHLVGALENWASLQDKYDCFYFVADWHALTSDYADTSEVVANAYDMVADWIAAGLDPGRSTLFIQSLVPEHAELYLLLSMTIPTPWLERVPTYKEQIEQLSEKDLSTLGFLGYPLLQTADIIIYNAHAVPVGEDQVPHLELSREIVRRFHNFYGQLFVEPQPLLTTFPRLPGLDNRKMLTCPTTPGRWSRRSGRCTRIRNGSVRTSLALSKVTRCSRTTTRSIPTRRRSRI